MAKPFGSCGLSAVTRGSNRRDLPTSGAGWIDYSCPAKSWEYWEGRFKKGIPVALQSAISRAMFDFRNYQIAWEAEKTERFDKKQIERGLKATEKTGKCASLKLHRFIEVNCLNLSDATISEKARYLLQEFSANPDDFTMERPSPPSLYTRGFYYLFRTHEMNVSLGSSADLNAIKDQSRNKDAPETAFVELARLCLWSEGPSVSFCFRIQALIKRCPVCSKI